MIIPTDMRNAADGMQCKGRVLIVDDEPNAIKVLSTILSDDGYKIRDAANVGRAVRILHEDDIDAIITDVKIPGEDGMQFFQYVTVNRPDIPVIFLTAYGTISSAVSAMNLGAFYYFIKPPDYLKLKGILLRAIEQRKLKKEVEFLRSKLSGFGRNNRIIGKTPCMRKVFEMVEAVKDSPTSVLICGETGTGKELIARAIHDSGRRSSMPFVAVNCAAMPKDLMEAELFGCEKGAFTGAVARRTGKFEEAGQGVVFLDELSEMEMPLQAKLLRVLQERELERLGSSRRIKVAFRLISSTNCDLRKEIRNGRFREDLYYRINVVEIHIPPLRERREDIPLLTSAFVQEFCDRERKNLAVSSEVMEIFMNHSWPGNIRQLRNVVESAVVLTTGDKIMPKSLSEDISSCSTRTDVCGALKTFREIELDAIRDSLRISNGNKSKAAKLLGISRKAFYKRLRTIDEKEAGAASPIKEDRHVRKKTTSPV